MDLENRHHTRRQFVKLLGSGVAAVYFTGCSSATRKLLEEPSRLSWGPILRNISEGSSEFSGDDPSRPHQVLWDKQGFLASRGGQLPPPSELVDVVIVGGGMSGLISTYFLKDQNVLLLEQASRLGGNSKGESWKGIDYSIGAAYTDIPEPGSPIAQFWQEIGVDQKFRIWNGADPLFFDGKLYRNCWEEGTIHGTRKQFAKLGKLFEDVLHSRNGLIYPEIPALTAEDRRQVDALDQISMRTFLERQLGEPLLPGVEEYIEHYFWTASAGSYSEISAAAGLNFFAGDFDKIAVFPGGNAAIAEAVVQQLAVKPGAQRLRLSSLVFDVRVDEQGVLVAYLNPKNEIKTVRARLAVMACPKFVAARVMDQLEPQRLAAIHSLKYRAYLVANALIEQPVKDDFYDAFFFKEKTRSKDLSVRELAHAQKVTDVILGSYAHVDANRTVLTLSRSMPYDGGRAEVYRKDAYQTYFREFEKQLTDSILPQLGIQDKSLQGLRLSRWGHPLPLSEVGNIASGRVDTLRKPFKERVFFIEQDNWTLPCFETAFHEAYYWTAQMRKILFT